MAVKPGPPGRLRLGAHLRVGFVMVGAPLGMADDHRTAPASASISAEISPVWAPDGFGVTILPADRDRGAARRGGKCRNQRRRRANHQIGLSGKPFSAGDDLGELRARTPPSPFIFQLPATSGISVAAAIEHPLARAVIRPAQQRQSARPRGRSFLSCKELARSLWCARPAWVRQRGHPINPSSQPRKTRACFAVFTKPPRPGSARPSWPSSWASWSSASRSGASATCSAASAATLSATIGGTEISIEQFRQYLQRPPAAIGPPARPADHARRGARARARPAAARPAGRRNHARRAGQAACGSASADADIAERITNDPSFRGPTASSTARASSRSSARPASPKAASSRSSGARMLRRQIAQSVTGDLKVPATAMAAINQYQNEKRAHRLSGAGRGAGRRHSRADAGGAEQIFRGTQDSVPRAGIPQDHRAGAVARPNSRSRTRSPTPTPRPISSSTRTVTARRRSASCSRSFFRTRRRPPPRANASPRARLSTTSPRNAA